MTNRTTTTPNPLAPRLLARLDLRLLTLIVAVAGAASTVGLNC